MSSDAVAKLAGQAAALNGWALPPLVLMTDDERLSDPAPAAQALPRGSLIVVRARDDARRRDLARMLARIARERGLFLLLADDPFLAAREGADGLHVPEKRAGIIAHWRALRPQWLFTASAHSLRAVLFAKRSGADAVFLSPVFPTRSHPERRALSPIRLRVMARQAGLPVYALGGLNLNNVGRLKGARLAGIAAIGAFALTRGSANAGIPRWR